MEAAEKKEETRRPQNRLLFWLAAALVPEAAAFQIENSRAAAQRAEIIRHLEAMQDDTTEDRRAA